MVRQRCLARSIRAAVAADNESTVTSRCLDGDGAKTSSVWGLETNLALYSIGLSKTVKFIFWVLGLQIPSVIAFSES